MLDLKRLAIGSSSCCALCLTKVRVGKELTGDLVPMKLPEADFLERQLNAMTEPVKDWCDEVDRIMNYILTSPAQNPARAVVRIFIFAEGAAPHLKTLLKEFAKIMATSKSQMRYQASSLWRCPSTEANSSPQYRGGDWSGGLLVVKTA